MIFDTHLHLNDEAYRDDLDNVIKTAKEQGVGTFLVVGYDLNSSVEAIEIANKYECCYAAIGYHPCDVFNIEDNLNKIKELALNNKKVIAIGEIGLDYHWEKEEERKNIEKKYFIEQINLANELNLPASLHIRDAIGDSIEILKEHPITSGAVFHCYSGSVETMKEIVKMGYYIAFGGTLTFKNSRVAKEVAAIVPLDRIVLETDCPYLAPHPNRGKVNRPEYINFVVDTLSEIRNLPREEIIKITRENSRKLFHV